MLAGTAGPLDAADAESTINQVISARIIKKQQTRSALRRAHLLLEARTRVRNDGLRPPFQRW